MASTSRKLLTHKVNIPGLYLFWTGVTLNITKVPS